MAANIMKSKLPLSEIVKTSGFGVPEKYARVTFRELVENGEKVTVQDVKEVTLSEEGTFTVEPAEGFESMKKVVVTVELSNGNDAESPADAEG